MCPSSETRRSSESRGFLVIKGSSPSLFYARETGSESSPFREGGEHEKNPPSGCHNKTFYRLSDHQHEQPTWQGHRRFRQGDFPLPESDFSGIHSVGHRLRIRRKTSEPAISDAIFGSKKSAGPCGEIDGTRVGIQLRTTFPARARKRAWKFLEEAEAIIEATVQQSEQS